MESLQPTPPRPDLPWADKIAYIAWTMRQNGGYKVEDFEVRHIFQPGRYIREFELPADFLFIGRVHRKGHLVELLSGSLKLITERGSTVYSAIDRMVTAPGFQTVLRTFTPIVARCVLANPNELRDIDELEDEFFEPAETVLVRGQGIQEQLWLE
jgi:hypothetical protein